MGGDTYARDVIPSNSNIGYSSASNNVIGTRNCLDNSMDPTQYCNTDLQCDNKCPIVLALDVTGSMGNWAKVNKFCNI